MAAFSLDDFVMIAFAKKRSHSKSGARTDDRNETLFGQRPLRSAQMEEIFVGQRRDGIADSTEIVDDNVAIDAEGLLNQGRTNHPGIVGELEDLAADGTGKGYGEFLWQ